MYGKALLVATALLAAAPAFAQSDKSAAGSDHSGPIPYSELAAADAKINGAGATGGHKAKHARHHAAKAKASAKTDASQSGAAAPAASGSTGAH